MNKKITYIAIAVAVLSAGIAQAQTSPTYPPQTTPTPKATTTAATKKAKLQEAVMKLERSLEVRIMNLDGLAARIQSRIAKVQQEGKDMTAATAKLAEAQKAIADAKTELANLKKVNATMVGAAKPATIFATVKNKGAKNVVAKIKIAHKALVDTIVIIKGQGMPQAATSTAR